MLAYDYMLIRPMLASLCKSKNICEKMFMTWITMDKWLGKDPKVLPKVIEQHFDGSKFHEY